MTAGNKLERRTNEVASSYNSNTAKQAITTYLGDFVYENNVLKFFGHEEGRIRNEQATTATCTAQPNRFIYDYFIKDHLGNVRMVLTEQKDDICYIPATVEDSRYITEQKFYDIADARRIARTTTGAPQTSFENKLYQTHGGIPGQKTGLGITLKVMAGDKVKITAESYYTLPSGGSTGSVLNMAFTDLLTALTNSSSISSAKGGVTVADVQNLGTNNTDLTNFITRTPSAFTAKAYLNWVLFDDRLKYVSSGADPVATGTSAGGGLYKQHTAFITNPVSIIKNGFLYVFVSNESNLAVYFDNLNLTHTPGPLLEETHYYPFGVSMAGISSKAAGRLENHKQFNGIEHTIDLDLNQYDAFYRTLDPQIGRFWQIDPEVDDLEHYSPYESMGNNPISNVDPLGDFNTRFGAWWHSLWNGGGDIRKNSLGEWFVRKTVESDSKGGGPTVTAQISYGKGRNRYSAAKEQLLSDQEEQQQINDFIRVGMWDPSLSPGEARMNTLGLGVNLLQPSAFIKPATIAINAQKVVAKIKIIFGTDARGLDHAMRHIDELGLSRSAVQTAIEEHLPTVASQIVEGKSLKQVIEVAGKKIQYSAFKLPDGRINVGKIYGVK